MRGSFTWLFDFCYMSLDVGIGAGFVTPEKFQFSGKSAKS